MKQRVWVVVILLAAVAVNAIAYAVIRSRRAPVEAPVPVAPIASTPSATAAPAPAAPAPAAEAAEAGVNEGLARARRAAGIAALEERDYDRAVAEFTEALNLRKDKGDLGELLKIAEDLRKRSHARASAEVAKPQREPPPSRTQGKAKQVRVASRAQPQEEPAAPAEPAKGGLLLVTSTPPGLVVMVDGKTVDLTPARVPVRAGSHRVVLAQGERRVYEDTVEVGEDVIRPINWEAKVEPASASAPPPAATPAVAVAPEVSRPAPASPAATAASAPASVTERTPAAKPPSDSGKGDLEISSPALYGEIWVNDRPYGFPPVVAQGIAAGQARVEVRVHGAVKRRMTVEVEPGRRTPVRVR